MNTQASQITKVKPEAKTLDRIDRDYIWSEIESVLNLDKGLFYTIKELFLRPGTTVKTFLLYDRKRLVKPLLFVIFSSIIFVIMQQIFNFKTGTTPEDLPVEGIRKAFNWAGENLGFVNIIIGFFIGFLVKLFFLKSKFNIYETFVLVFFTVGMGNLIFVAFGVFETITSLEFGNIPYLFALLYSAWAIGSFFDKYKAWSYIKGFLAYFLGTTIGSFLIVIMGLLVEIINRKM